MSNSVKDEVERLRACAICQTPRKQHEELEAAGELHHKFSERGELVHSKPEKKQKITVAPDLVLRMALIDAGIITEGQLTMAEAKIRDGLSGGGRTGDRGDRPDRPTQSA